MVGFHPLVSFLDHGTEGTGEPLAALQRPGKAGSNTAADHITVVRDSLKQLPAGYQSGRKVMIRTESASGIHEFLHWLTNRHRNLRYSVGFPIHGAVETVLPKIPKNAWARAYNSDGIERDGAWVAEITGMLDLGSWPDGMRVIVRKEEPHPGAQLRITDVDGMRYTAFATNQKRGQLADLEVCHRLRARCEDRIRGAKDTGLANLPLYSFAANTLWCHLVMLAFHGTKARSWEPKKLRARIFEIAGKISTHARRLTLHLSAAAPRNKPADQRPGKDQGTQPAIDTQPHCPERIRKQDPHKQMDVEPSTPRPQGQRLNRHTHMAKSTTSGSQ